MSTTTEAPPQQEQESEPERALRSVEDMAAEEADGGEQETDGTPQLVIPGTGSKLTGNVGGLKPTQSAFKMKAVSLPISGNAQLDKDETIWIAVECEITNVGVQNLKKGRETVGVVRTHTAQPIGTPMLLDGPPA